MANKDTKLCRALRVFLCHSSGDKPAVRKLHRYLRSENIDPWLDEEKLLPGQDWELEITEAVRHSDVVIVCLSQSSISKTGYVQKEIRKALDIADQQPEGTIFLIPFKLEECDIPERLRRWQWVNSFEERGHERLMLALQVRTNDLGLRPETEDTFGAVLESPPSDEISVETLMRKRNQLENLVDLRFKDKGLERGDGWQWAIQSGVMSMNDMRLLGEIRLSLNRLSDSETVPDGTDLAYWMKKAEELISRLNSLRQEPG